ncbi:na+/H+ antiporter family protein, partial [Vibrio parahaemolyticus V-223/04]
WWFYVPSWCHTVFHFKKWQAQRLGLHSLRRTSSRPSR